MRRARSSSVSVLVGCLAALALALALVVTVPTAPVEAATPAQKYGKKAQKVTNTIRANRDLVRLKGNPCLRKHARRHARAMAQAQAIWHQDMRSVLDACNLSMVGENVAMGYSTGRAVVRQGWMKSEGHRRNILRKEYRLGVVVAAKGSDDQWYAAQLFGRR